MTPEPMLERPRHRWILLLILLIFLVLALAGALTRAPWCDEAYFAEPAYQILNIGRMAALVNPPSPIDDPRTVGADRYLYWVMPLDIVLQAGWYWIVGFGMIQMRVLAMLWGLAAIGAWWMILRSMGADARLRLVGVALIALDYSFIRSGSEGRMDMMSAALGFIGIALFLKLETRSYPRAVLAACSCAAASFFTHPIGGMLATVGVGVTMLWYARGRFRPWHVLLAAVPYGVGAAGWGLYIMQAPDLFRLQLLNPSGGRLNAWQQPFTAVWQEFTRRWAGVFGLIAGSSGLKRVRALVLVAYAAGFLYALVRFRKLTHSGFGMLFAVGALDLALLCLFDSTKSAAYLIHVVPWLGAMLAVLLVEYWRPIGALTFAAVIAIQVAGSAYTVSRRQYQTEYLPAIEIIRQHGSKVTGDAQLGFALGFQGGLIDDRRLGFYLPAKPALFAIDDSYEDAYVRYREEHPEIYKYVQDKLLRSRLLFQNSLFRIYEDPHP